jgi:malonate transporter
LLGFIVAALPWSMPDVLLEPFTLIGAAAPPLALLTLGMALVAAPRAAGQVAERSGAGSTRMPVLVATVARAVIHPCLAWGLGTALGLSGTALAIVVTMAALPTAQNVVVYATRYRCSVDVASRACVVTTALCGPVLIVIAAVL